MSETKSSISSGYMEDMKAKHAGKKLPSLSDRSFMVTGVGPNNIGESICDELNELHNTVIPMTIDDYDFETDSGLVHMYDFDTLIMCHGITVLNWIEEQEYEDIDTMIEVNLTSHIKTISDFAVKEMDTDYRKTIVVIGSMAASSVLNGSSPYCAAKAGLQHFIKCVAYELAPKGFDVYIVNPSNVANAPMSVSTVEQLARYREIEISQAWEYWAANHPRNEFLSKKEIAVLVKDLVYGKFPYLSGTPLNLAGGQR